MKTCASNICKVTRRFFAYGIFFGIALSCGGSARAQGSAPWNSALDVSGNYSYLYGNSSDSNGTFPVNGGGASIGYNFGRSLAAVGDVGAYRFGGLAVGIHSTMYTYLFGPRISIFRRHRFAPFVEALAGGARLNATSGPIQAGENAFAMAAGGGIDAPLGRHFSLRAIQADYLHTHFPHANGLVASQNNIRISAGITFHLGSGGSR
jgi:hypothetical protein